MLRFEQLLLGIFFSLTTSYFVANIILLQKKRNIMRLINFVFFIRHTSLGTTLLSTHKYTVYTKYIILLHIHPKSYCLLATIVNSPGIFSFVHAGCSSNFLNVKPLLMTELIISLTVYFL